MNMNFIIKKIINSDLETLESGSTNSEESHIAVESYEGSGFSKIQKTIDYDDHCNSRNEGDYPERIVVSDSFKWSKTSVLKNKTIRFLICAMLFASLPLVEAAGSRVIIGAFKFLVTSALVTIATAIYLRRSGIVNYSIESRGPLYDKRKEPDVPVGYCWRKLFPSGNYPKEIDRPIVKIREILYYRNLIVHPSEYKTNTWYYSWVKGVLHIDNVFFEGSKKGDLGHILWVMRKNKDDLIGFNLGDVFSLIYLLTSLIGLYTLFRLSKTYLLDIVIRSMEFVRADLGKTKLIFYTFGTYEGDVVPIEAYADLYKDACDVETVQVLTKDEGRALLHKVEAGDVLTPLWDLKKLSDAVDRRHPDAIPVVPNRAGAYRSGCVTYSLAPPSHVLKVFRIFKDKRLELLNYLYTFIRTLTSRIDVIIFEGEGCAPRLDFDKGGDIKPLNERSNQVFIATGNSSSRGDQPKDWVDHDVIFRDTRKIVCHGGGTAQRAKYLGCEVEIIDDFLDRDITDYNLLEKRDSSIMTKAIVNNSDLVKSVRFTLNLIDAGNPHSVSAITTLIWRILSSLFIYVLSLVAALAALNRSFSVTYWSFDEVIWVALFGQGVSTFSPIGGLLVSEFRKRAGNELVYRIAKTGFSMVVSSLNDHVFAWVFFRSACQFGLIWSFILAKIIVCLRRPSFHVPIFLIFEVWMRTLNFFRYNGDNIQLRFKPIERVPVPLLHSYLYDPVKKRSIGITIDKTKTTVTTDDVNSSFVFSIDTGIPSERFEECISKVRLDSGKTYSPLLNCQTALWKLLKDKEEFPMGAKLFFLMMLILSCILLYLFALCYIPIVLYLIANGLSIFDGSVSLRLLGTLGDGTWQGTALDFYIYVTRVCMADYGVTDEMFAIPKTRFPVQMPGRTDLKIDGKTYDLRRPTAGLWRPGYTDHRDGNPNRLHGVANDCPGPSRQLPLVVPLPGVAKGLTAVVAESAERKLSQGTVDLLSRYVDSIICLTNRNVNIKGVTTMVYDLKGRELASLRLRMAKVKGVTWLSVDNKISEEFMRQIPTMVRLFSSNNLRCLSGNRNFFTPVAAGCMLYREPFDMTIKASVYGSDEISVFERRHEQPVGNLVRVSDILFTAYRKCSSPNTVKTWFYTDIGCKRITENSCETIDAVKICKFLEDAIFVDNTAYDAVSIETRTINHNLSKLNKETFGEYMKLNKPNLYRYKENMSVASAAITGVLKEGVVPDYINQLLGTVDKRTKVTSRKLASVKTGHKAYLAEMDLILHENPKFVDATFDETLRHYISALNGFKKKGQKMSIGQFRREVNRNPYIDTWLKEKTHNLEFEEGFDGQSIACREVMLSSLVRYCGERKTDSITDKQSNEIVTAIINSNKQIFTDARLCNPKSLLNHFLKHKTYSAGLPFIGSESNDIRRRKDLVRYGWLKPLTAMATMPFETGEWYPSIAHAFSKSQVVNVDKLIKNPAKLRSVTATSVITNLQKGVLNFDINNRHDPLRSLSKVGMTTNGRYMSEVFSQASKYRRIVSADISSMDSNLPDVIFKIEGMIRKEGFKNHPASATINKHLDCAMEITKRGYIINLIEKSMDSIYQDSHILKRVENEKLAEIRKIAKDNAFYHPTCPGGIIRKSHGGYTGDSDTTWTNSTALPIIMMWCYHKVTGRQMKEFGERTCLANVGDDNVFAYNEDIDFDRFCQVAKEDFGVEMRIEGTGDSLYGQTFLGKVPLRINETIKKELEIAGAQEIKIPVMHDPSRLMSRYVDYKAEAARHFKNKVSKLLYMLQHDQGYSNLTAHNKETYDLISEHHAMIMSKIPDKMKTKSFLKRYCLLSYDQILKNWYKRSKHEGYSELKITTSPLAKVRSGLMHMVDYLYWIDDKFGMNLSVPSARIENHNSVGLVEEHAFWSLYTENNEIPTLLALSNRVKLSPFWKISDSETWYRVNMQDFAAMVSQKEGRIGNCKRRIALTVMFYQFSSKMLNLVRLIPGGSILVSMFSLYSNGLPRLKNTVDLVSYVNNGQGAKGSFYLVLDDHFEYHKRVSILVSKLIDYAGEHWCDALIVKAGMTADSISKVASLQTRLVNDQLEDNHLDDDDEWNKLAKYALLETSERPLISAPCGAGKTRFLPSRFVNKRMANGETIMKVVVVMPRNKLCSSYCDFSNANFIRRGNSSNIKKLNTCTYGYLSEVMKTNSDCELISDENVFYIFDECHEDSLDIKYILKSKMFVGRSCLVTATPNDVSIKHKTFALKGYKSPYSVQVLQTIEDVDGALFRFHRSKTLVIIPSKNKAKKFASKMTSRGFQVCLLTAEDVHVQDNANLYIGTSVVDSGITIPGIDLVIDSGLAIGNEGGDVMTKRLTKSLSVQRMGRTGRTNNGRYVLIGGEDYGEGFNPAPSTRQVLSGDAFLSVCPITNNFERNPFKPGFNSLTGDHYVRFYGTLPNEVMRKKVSVMHGLTLEFGNPESALRNLVSHSVKGRESTAVEAVYNACECGPMGLHDINHVYRAYTELSVYYQDVHGNRFKNVKISKMRVEGVDPM